MKATAPQFAIQRSKDRAFFDHGWLKTYHSFSFADYQDPSNSNWGALRVFNDDTVAPGEGFPTHPHRDMEIITYVLSGELEHKDSMGNTGVVGPGGVQYMSAGTGVRHSEFNHSKQQPLHFVQMWVLPAKTGLHPRYGQKDFSLDDRRNRFLLVASGVAGESAPIELWQAASFSVARFETSSLVSGIAPGRLGFLFVAGGEIAVGGEILREGDAARIAGPYPLVLSGSGELLMWDLPPIE